MLTTYDGTINKDNIMFYNHSKINFINPNSNRNLSIDRLEHSDIYLNIVNQIWTKIYSNIQIPYNGYIGNFIPLDLTELLYT